jgi:hypothetical protein
LFVQSADSDAQDASKWWLRFHHQYLMASLQPAIQTDRRRDSRGFRDIMLRLISFPGTSAEPASPTGPRGAAWLGETSRIEKPM